MKQYVLMGALALMVTGLTGCGGCTEEEAAAKAMEVTTKMQSLAGEDMGKLMELSKKMQEIGNDLNDANDPDEVCAALDEVLAELD